jgi:hypothetical protein
MKTTYKLILTDWKSATEAMKDFDIDTYLADLNVAVDSVGGRVHLIASEPPMPNLSLTPSRGKLGIIPTL